jgi:protocatechuate 3,4-dioxygenase beta subunit
MGGEGIAMNDNQMSARSGWLAAAWALMMLVIAPPAGAEMLRGVVLDKEGRPVGGAIVWTAELYAPGPLAARETQADDSGRFALDLKPGRWYVWTRHDGWAGEIDQRAIPTVVPGRDPRPVTLRLRERGWLRGRLIEAETGRPIAGGRFVIDNGVELKANKLGRFELVGISPRYHEAYVVAPGRERRRILFDMTLHVAAEVDLRIPRGGRIFGRVTDEEGRPIPGAFVGYHTSGNTFSGTANWERCDPDGRYVWDGKVFDRPTRLEAWSPGYLGEEKDSLIVGTGSGPLELNFRLKLDPGRQAKQAGGPPPKAAPRREVTGTVTLPGGQPAAKALVRWVWTNDSESRETETDAQGHFRLTGIPDADGFLVVIAPRATDTAPGLVRVQGNGNREIAIALGPGQTAKGRVLDDAGKPVEGVTIAPFWPWPDPRFGLQISLFERSATTDAKGRFSLQGLPNSRIQFDFRGDGLDVLSYQSLDLGGTENEVRMQSGGMIRGRVVDRDGQPVRDFRILINTPHEQHPGDKFASYFAGYCGIGITFTSDDGSFVITDLGAAGGLCRISVVADGYGEEAVDRVISTTLTHLPPDDALTIRLGPPHHFRVRAVRAGEEARGVPGARVTLVNGDPGLDRQFSWGYHDTSWEDMTRGRTDKQGWADFPGLACGQATVLVQAPGFGRRRLGWRDGRTELIVPLQPEAGLAGEVRDAAGAPLKDAYISLVGSSGDSMMALVDGGQQGRFRLAELPEGEYTFTIQRSSGSELHQERLTLRPGQVLDKMIRLSRGADEKTIREGAAATPAR